MSGNVDVVVVVNTVMLLLRYLGILLIWSTLRQIVIVLHIWTGHVWAVLLVLVQRVTGLVEVHEPTVVLLHDLLLTPVDFLVV